MDATVTKLGDAQNPPSPRSVAEAVSDQREHVAARLQAADPLPPGTERTLQTNVFEFNPVAAPNRQMTETEMLEQMMGFEFGLRFLRRFLLDGWQWFTEPFRRCSWLPG